MEENYEPFDDDDFAELEDEMEMDELLTKMNAKLDKLREREHIMRMGAHSFELNDKDPIFFLNGPNRNQVRTGSCVSCKQFIFESEK